MSELDWFPPVANKDDSVTTATLCGRFAILRTGAAGEYRYIPFEFEDGCRYVLGGFDSSAEAKAECGRAQT